MSEGYTLRRGKRHDSDGCQGGEQEAQANTRVRSERKAMEKSVAVLGSTDTHLPICKGQKINSN